LSLPVGEGEFNLDIGMIVAFKADLAKGTQDLDPRNWQEAAQVIAETVETPDDLATYIRSLLKAE
jgi:hypothetical protein